MVVTRAQRRKARRTSFERDFGTDAAPALDLIDLLELAWHDCYREPTIPDAVLRDVLALAAGDLRALVSAALLAVVDSRDLRLAADQRRTSSA